jgi:four helix bundle protein
MKNFRDLKVWHKAHSLTKNIYRVTSTFPREELYGLTSQIRRSCASVPTNIAEGCGRNTDVELARFLEISMGSASELEYLLLLTSDLEILNGEDHKDLTSELIEIKCMLASLIKRLRAEHNSKRSASAKRAPAS